MHPLNWFQSYIISLIKKNRFIQFYMTTGVGKTNIILNYAKSIPDKKIGIICVRLIFQNYIDEEDGTIKNVEYIPPMNMKTIDLNIYDVLVVHDMDLRYDKLEPLLHQLDRGKQLIFFDVRYSGPHHRDILNPLIKQGILVMKRFTIETITELERLHIRDEKIRKIKNRLLENSNI